MLDELIKSLPTWAVFVIAFVFGTGGIGLIAYIARPAKDTIADLRADVDTLQKQVDAGRVESAAQQRQINRALQLIAYQGHSITALTMHSDQLRDLLLRHDPDAEIETAAQVLRRVHETLEANPVQFFDLNAQQNTPTPAPPAGGRPAGEGNGV